MSLNTNSNALAEKLQSRDATREPTWVRYTLITIALIFGGVLKSMLTLNEAIIDVKEG